jgi:hypothetical protein
VVHVDLGEDQAVLVGGGSEQMRGVTVGVDRATDPLAVDREQRPR